MSISVSDGSVGIHDRIASACINLYLSHRKFHPPPRSNGIPQYTILSGIVLASSSSAHSVDKHPDLMCVSLGTGSKCLPASKLPRDGAALHDSHAEIVARRGAVRWFLEEIQRSVRSEDGFASDWIERDLENEGEEAGTAGIGMWKLRENVSIHMYVSTLPCEFFLLLLECAFMLTAQSRLFGIGGDASTLALALSQDPKMAALKSANSLSLPPSSNYPEHVPTAAPGCTSRGRDDYSAIGVLRTKPGRADSPSTLSMSCSDKIAFWTLLGLQGALLSSIMNPIYLDSIIVGEMDQLLEDAVRGECERAFIHRLKPSLSRSFIHLKTCLEFIF